jgi:hypothetical protein
MFKAHYKVLKKFFKTSGNYRDEKAMALIDKNIFISFWCDTVDKLLEKAKGDILYILIFQH